MAVAWADGSVHEKEGSKIRENAESRGIGVSSARYEVLLRLIEDGPPEGLTAAWTEFMSHFTEGLSEDSRAVLRDNFFTSAKSVAAAAGGVIGIGKISSVEKEVLTAIESACT